MNGNSCLLYTSDAAASPTARVEAGVVAELVDCESNACNVKAEQYSGWIDRPFLWGIYPPEGEK